MRPNAAPAKTGGNRTISSRRRNRRGASFSASLSSAFEALWANRLRSLLTILGVIVGVGAVLSAVTLTQGVSASVNSRLTGLGTNLLTITPAPPPLAARVGRGGAETLTQADADALTAVAHVSAVSPIKSSSSQVIFGGQNWNTRIQGVYPNFQSSTVGPSRMAPGSPTPTRAPIRRSPSSAPPSPRTSSLMARPPSARAC